MMAVLMVISTIPLLCNQASDFLLNYIQTQKGVNYEPDTKC